MYSAPRVWSLLLSSHVLDLYLAFQLVLQADSFLCLVLVCPGCFLDALRLLSLQLVLWADSFLYLVLVCLGCFLYLLRLPFVL